MSPTLRAAAYVRTPANRRQPGLKRQKKALLQLAERENCEIVEWFEDRALTAHSNFNRMLKQSAERRFDAVLLTKQSYLTGPDWFAVCNHVEAFQRVGVALVTVERGKVDFDDFMSRLALVAEGYLAPSTAEVREGAL